jgi:4-hydroxy-tetrahydrodipicolinate synthase
MAGNSGFSGVYPMLYGYFEASGGLDRRAFRVQVERAIRQGVDGIGVLGLATETNKLSTAERLVALDAAAEAVAGRVPLSVTIAETTVEGQRSFAKAALAAGARWLILQPPPAKDVAEADLIGFFGAVAESVDATFAIQNAPMYLGIGLGHAGLKELARRHPNIRILKIEDEPLAIPPLLEATEGRFDVFVGRGGMEMLAAVKAGAVGLIPGLETCDRTLKAFRLAASDPDAALAAYREAESAIVFLEKSLNHFVTYGKELAALRLGFGPVHHRLPFPMTEFGKSLLADFASRLGPL